MIASLLSTFGISLGVPQSVGVDKQSDSTSDNFSDGTAVGLNVLWEVTVVILRGAASTFTGRPSGLAYKSKSGWK